MRANIDYVIIDSALRPGGRKEIQIAEVEMPA